MQKQIKKFSFIFFHLNLFFSALPKNQRKDVINKCYWPLLRLIDNTNLKIGIEISGWSLEEIKKLDLNWILYFKKLLSEKKTYLIGSSYTQAIFPLIPYEINKINIKHGKLIYKKILNQIPKIAYVNEQCFSKSIVDLYKEEGYENLIMDWDSIKINKKISSKLKFFPQFLKGNKRKIKVIWNSSNNFQNFQKYIHSRLDITEYADTFRKTNKFNKGIACIYGSDAEIFDFRLKRFENESAINKNNISEWQKIQKLLINFNENYEFLDLNKINKIFIKSRNNYQLVDITSFDNILPTKKQKKYNPLRWYVGGTNNYSLNTLCWKIYFFHKSNKKLTKNISKKLCYLWSSDFRTHIDKGRWSDLNRKIKLEIKNLAKPKYPQLILKEKIDNLNLNNNFDLTTNDENYYYEDDKCFFKLDKIRGLNLIDFGLKSKNTKFSLIKKINQGYFSHERLKVDFYNGHTVLENMKYKYSDLDDRGKMNHVIKDNFLIFSNKYFLENLFIINKKWYFDINSKILYFYNKIVLYDQEFSYIRSNYFNINNEIFDLKNLKFSTKNGGEYFENFFLNKRYSFFDDDPLSSKHSAQNCFGNTCGQIFFWDNQFKINFNIYHQVGSLAPMLNFQYDKDSRYFLRLLSSYHESNEIINSTKNKKMESLISIKISY